VIKMVCFTRLPGRLRREILFGPRDSSRDKWPPDTGFSVSRYLGAPPKIRNMPIPIRLKNPPFSENAGECVKIAQKTSL
jgi:hypothetical protein